MLHNRESNNRQEYDQGTDVKTCRHPFSLPKNKECQDNAIDRLEVYG